MAKLTSPSTDHRPRWGLRARGAIALLVVALLGAVGLTALLSSGSDDAKADAAARKAIEDYQAKLFPLAEEWGKIEIQGMRPAISDLADGDEEGVPAVTIAGEARAWQAGLQDLRKKIAALPAPRALARAKLLFDKAMVRYIAAAVAFEQAADGPPEGRRAGIDKGIDAALDGARIYNDASLVLQRARRDVGLPATADFPDQPAGEQDVSD